MSRKYDALRQRMYLLHAQEHEIVSGWQFVVEGASGTAYTICFGAGKGCSCTCPDFEYRHKYCKHIYFIIGRVAKDEATMYTLKQSHDPDAFVFDEELNGKIRAVLGKREGGGADHTHALQSQPKADDLGCEGVEVGPIHECPICYEIVSPAGVPDNHVLDRETCPTCHKVLHRSCMLRWWKNKKTTCPMCRSTFIDTTKNCGGIMPSKDDHLSKFIQSI